MFDSKPLVALALAIGAGCAGSFQIRTVGAAASDPVGETGSPSAGPPKPPAIMHWCAQHCATWIWVGDRYVGAGTPRPESTPQCGVRVEQFTREWVVMFRTDCGTRPGKATLTGRISADGNSIVDGSITWTWHPCRGLSSGTYAAACGPALDTVPGSSGGRYTSKDPGSFVCRGLFARRNASVRADPGADEAADLTARAGQAHAETGPEFVEWYKVKPLGSGRYRLTLLPSSLQLAKQYEVEFDDQAQ